MVSSLKNQYDMGRTTLIEHSIDTGDNRPIRQGLRRHPMVHLDIIDTQVDEMLRHDLVSQQPAPGQPMWCWCARRMVRIHCVLTIEP